MDNADAIADQVFELIRPLSSPALAGYVLANVQARIFIAAGATSDEQINLALATMAREVIKEIDELKS
jgi:hypothetical protein